MAIPRPNSSTLSLSRDRICPKIGMEGAQGGRSRFENLIGPIPAVPGLKFHPSNEEVINFYLPSKIAGNLVGIDPIRTDQDIISRHPGTLQAHYPLLPLENAWWFYTTRDSKYPNNSKPKIERSGGYWKVSKASDPIGDIGFKRVLNFREGFLKPSSTPTDWFMEEYSIKQFAPNKEDENWIIVRIYQQLPRSQLISAGSLSPDLEEILLNLDWNSGGWSGSGYPFEPLGSGGTGMEGGRSRYENLIRHIPAVLGLKFHPTNEEVINPYLQNKNARYLVEIDPIRTDQEIISHHPGTFQANYPLLPPENAWWFYTTRDSKYPNNSKPKIERAGGYWKVSKASNPIGDIGFKRVLHFREGSLKSSSVPTDWYMEEYSIKQFAPNKEDENWIIARIYQQLTMPLTNIVPMTIPLSTMPIHTTFPLTMSMPTPYVSTIRPREILQPTYFVPSQSPRSPLISAGSLSPDPEIQAWPNSHANSGEWSGSAYYLPLDSGEGVISGSAYPFQPPGSGGTDFLLRTAEAMAKEKQKRTVADKEKKRLTTARKREENSYPVVQVFRERNTSVVIRDEQDIMRLRKDKRKAEAMAMEKQNGTVADKGKKKITTVGKGKENSCPATFWSNTARTRDTSGTRGDMSGHAT